MCTLSNKYCQVCWIPSLASTWHSPFLFPSPPVPLPYYLPSHLALTRSFPPAPPASPKLPQSFPRFVDPHSIPPPSLPCSLPRSLPRSLARSLPRSLAPSLAHSLARSLSHWLTRSLLAPPSPPCPSFPRCLAPSLALLALPRSLPFLASSLASSLAPLLDHFLASLLFSLLVTAPSLLLHFHSLCPSLRPSSLHSFPFSQSAFPYLLSPETTPYFTSHTYYTTSSHSTPSSTSLHCKSNNTTPPNHMILGT